MRKENIAKLSEIAVVRLEKMRLKKMVSQWEAKRDFF